MVKSLLQYAQENKQAYIDACNAVFERGGSVYSGMPFSNLADKIISIPHDQSLGYQTIESNAERVIVPKNVEGVALVNKIGGMSKKCNQLLKLRTLNETQDGITVITNKDGSYTFNGVTGLGASFSLWLSSRDIPYTSLGAGRTYKISVEIIGEVTWDANMQSFVWIGESYPEDSSPNFEVTYVSSGLHKYTYIPEEGRYLEWIDVVFPEHAEVNNVTVKIMVNEGNEYLPYEPYFDGIKDSKVTDIMSEGRNLCNPANAYMASGAIISQTENSFIVKGNTSATPNQSAYSLGWFYPHGTETNEYAIVAEKGKPIQITYQVKLIEYGGYFDTIQILLRIQPDDGSSYIYTYGKRVTIDENTQTIVTSVTPTATGKSAILFAINGNTVELSNILITRGNNTEYSPYKGIISTTNIPTAVQNLEGYGEGINSNYYNYIEWRNSRCYFIITCEKVTYNGTEKWYAGGASDGLYRPYTPISLPSVFIDQHTKVPCICNLYNDKTAYETYRHNVGVSVDKNNIRIYDARYNTADISLWTSQLAQWNADGHPLTVIYPLETPIEIDITDLMTVDNAIVVEGGGSISFGVSVPSSTSYLIQTAAA